MDNANKPAPFASDHPWDRNFFLAIVLLGWFAIVMGFGPTVMNRFTGKADYPAPLSLQIHVFSFLGWMALFSVQILLVRMRRWPIHRTLGLVGLALIPVMVVSGVMAEAYSQRFYIVEYPENPSFFIVPLTYCIVFPLLAGAGLWWRRYPDVHKRLMLLATLYILGVPFGRWLGEDVTALVGDGFFGAIINLYFGVHFLLILAVAYDLLTRKRIHIVYLICVPLILISQLIVSWIYHSPDWPPLARYLVGL